MKDRLKFYNVDLCDRAKISLVFEENCKNSILGVIHFAGLKSVGDSCENPREYWYNNVTSTVNLIEMMEKSQIYNIIYSSSACVYGIPERIPILEDFPLRPANPYGSTKVAVESLLKDLCLKKNSKWRAVTLR